MRCRVKSLSDVLGKKKGRGVAKKKRKEKQETKFCRGTYLLKVKTSHLPTQSTVQSEKRAGVEMSSNRERGEIKPIIIRGPIGRSLCGRDGYQKKAQT